MHTRLWVAGTATAALVGTGVFIATPTIHGQSPAPKPQTDVEVVVEKATRAAQDAVKDIDVKVVVDEAMRSAQEAMKDIDVKVLVDDAMQGVGDLGGGRLRLGIQARDTTADEAKAAGLPGITGAFVIEVPAESPGAKGGLQANDIILTVDGEAVRSAQQLSRLIVESPEGKALPVAYVRGTTRGTATVTPERQAPMRWTMRDGDGGEAPMVRRFERRVVPGGPGANEEFDILMAPNGGGAGPRAFSFRGMPQGEVRIRTSRGRLGVMAQPLTPQLATFFAAKAGVLVSQVNENTPAAKAGIKAGDVITSVNGKPVTEVGDIIDSLEGVADGKAVPVEIVRDKKPQTVQVTLQAPANTSGERSVTRTRRFTA